MEEHHALAFNFVDSERANFKASIDRFFCPAGSDGLIVAPSDLGGKGLFAAKSFEVNEMMLVEAPICSVLEFTPRQLTGEISENGECECCLSEVSNEETRGLEFQCMACDQKWCSFWCKVRMETLHKFGRCCCENWSTFLANSQESENEYFILAARLFLMVELTLPDRTESLGPPSNSALVDKYSELPWAHFVAEPWWELIGPEVSAATKQRAEEFTVRQCTLLFDVLPKCSLAQLLTPRTLSLTMGMARMNVLGTNSFRGLAGMGMFPVQSRTNHSCDPSAEMTVYDDYEGVQTFAGMAVMRATKAIAAGEEITIDYLDGSPASEGKRADLLANYRFNCRCTLCADVQQLSP
jgi:hypothetical protein